jgi:hypothetical protein
MITITPIVLNLLAESRGSADWLITLLRERSNQDFRGRAAPSYRVGPNNQEEQVFPVSILGLIASAEGPASRNWQVNSNGRSSP